MQTLFFSSSLARGSARAFGRCRLAGSLLGLALLVGACAQPDTSRMGGPGDSAEPASAEPARAQRKRDRPERPQAAPGDVNQTDTNLERGGQPATDAIKSGPPSIVKPVQ